MSKVLTLVLTIFVVSIVAIGISYFSYSNSEIRVRNQISAQQETNAASFDKMWKVISQKAQVSDEYKESFKEIYPELIKGRYSNGQGQMMQWIQEHNPTFDVSLYKDLSRAIESERQSFFVEQKKLIDLGREHDNMLQVFPSSIFIGSRGKIKLTIIKSENTEEVFKAGKEELKPLF